jgi:hypothetical protein
MARVLGGLKAAMASVAGSLVLKKIQIRRNL